jgi:hypothetical protein
MRLAAESNTILGEGIAGGESAGVTFVHVFAATS